jgi:hypothetical protein
MGWHAQQESCCQQEGNQSFGRADGGWLNWAVGV